MPSDFKDKMLLLAIGCSVWAILVSGLTSLDDLGAMSHRSELPSIHLKMTAESPLSDEFQSICVVLNYAIPVSFACIAMMLLNFRYESGGKTGLVVVVALFVFAYSTSIRAATTVGSYSKVPVSDKVWWMSEAP